MERRMLLRRLTVLASLACIVTLLAPAISAGSPTAAPKAPAPEWPASPSSRLATGPTPEQRVSYFNAYSAVEDLGQTTAYLFQVAKDYYYWNSYPAIQNLGDVASLVTVDFYLDASWVYSTTRTVPPYAAWYLDLAALPLPVGAVFSLVAHADGPIAAIQNEATYPAASYGEAYGGLTAGLEMYVPYLPCDEQGWNSSLIVQDVGAAATDVLVTYSDGLTQGVTLAPYQTWLFYQPAVGHTCPGVFSALVGADQPLVAAVSTADPSVNNAAYEVSPGGATELLLPFTAKDAAGLSSVVRVLNVGPISTTVSVTYEGYAGDTYAVTIGPQATYLLDTTAEPFLPSGYQGALHLVSQDGQPLLANTAVSRPDDPLQDDTAGYALPLFAARKAEQPITFSQFYPLVPKEYNEGGASLGATLVLANAGTSQAAVLATFYDENGAAYIPVSLGPGLSNPFLLDAGASQSIDTSLITALPPGQRYSAVLSADQPIVGVAFLAGGGELPFEPVHDADFTWWPFSPVEGQTVFFDGTAQGSLPITYTWDFGDGGSAAGPSPTHTYGQAGTYTVVMTASNAPTATASAVHTLTVVPFEPVHDADFTWSPVSPVEGQTVFFDGTAQGSLPIAYTWAFGDGNWGVGPNPTHAYSQAGTYTVVLTASNAPTATTSAVHTLTVTATVTGLYLNSYTALVDQGQTLFSLPKVMKEHNSRTSHLAIANLTAEEISATVDFYNGGTVVYSITRPLPAHSPWNLYLETVAGLPDGFFGRATVHATGAIAVVANEVSSASFNQAYSGFSSGASTLYVPDLYYDYYYWNSTLGVQNLGAFSATVLVSYSDGVTHSLVLPPNGVEYIYVPDEPHPPGAKFSAVVSGDQPLAAIAEQVNPIFPSSAAYEALAGGMADAYVPFVASDYPGLLSHSVVQNVGSATTTVTLTYEGYATATYSITLAPGETHAIYTAAEPFLPAGYHGALHLVSDNGQPLVAITNIGYELVRDRDALASYSVPPTTGTTLYYALAGKTTSTQGDGTGNTTLAVVNTGAVTTTVSATFYDEFGNAYTPDPLSDSPNPFPLGPGASQLIALVAIPDLPDGRYAAVLSADQPLAGSALFDGEGPPCQPVAAVDFSWAPPTPTAGLAITFTAAASGSAPISFTWDLGDGTLASGITVTHVYTTAGTFTIALTATNGCGADVAQKALTVRWIKYIYLPLLVKEYAAP